MTTDPSSLFLKAVKIEVTEEHEVDHPLDTIASRVSRRRTVSTYNYYY